MPDHLAKAIRIWRMRDGYTWAQIGRAARESFAINTIEADSVLGERLCREASAQLGESWR